MLFRSMLHQQELLATMQLSSFQKVGLVRYDAFDDIKDHICTLHDLCISPGDRVVGERFRVQGSGLAHGTGRPLIVDESSARMRN